MNVTQLAEPPLVALGAAGLVWAARTRWIALAGAAVMLTATQSAAFALAPADPGLFVRPFSEEAYAWPASDAEVERDRRRGEGLSLRRRLFRRALLRLRRRHSGCPGTSRRLPAVVHRGRAGARACRRGRPTPLPVNPLRRRGSMFRNRGNAVWCPVCDRRFARFGPAPNRGDAICWRCGSQERRRAQALLFAARPELLADATALLHFAPEHCLRTRLAGQVARYVTADLDPDGVDLRMDVTGPRPPRRRLRRGDLLARPRARRGRRDGDARTACVTAPGGWCLCSSARPGPCGRLRGRRDHRPRRPRGRLPPARPRPPLRPRRARNASRQPVSALQTIRPAVFGGDVMRQAGLLDVDWLFLCS